MFQEFESMYSGRFQEDVICSGYFNNMLMCSGRFKNIVDVLLTLSFEYVGVFSMFKEYVETFGEYVCQIWTLEYVDQIYRFKN